MNLKITNISKKFKGFELKDIDLEIREGEFFVIVGPSGAGKTLILEIIAGLLKPDSGEIYGIKNKKIGFIYQDYMLFPHLNVFKNIAYGLNIRKIDKNEIKSRVEDLALKLEIKGLLQRNVANLSGGEKQRVAIARAMAISPDIFLFDEPTSALDRNSRIKTREMFIKLHKKTCSTFIHVTHDFEEALSLADRIGILINGRIIQCGKPDHVLNSPENKEIADFLGYKNVFGGRIGNNKLNINNLNIIVPIERADFAYIAIRSDDIIISKNKIESSARNSFFGEVEDIFKKSSMYEVILNVGIKISIDITRKSFEEMEIKIGDNLWATFKVSSLKVFKH